MNYNKFITVFILLFMGGIAFSQDDEENSLLDLLGEDEEITNYAQASFKTTTVVNLASIENTHAGVLDFKIMHRFGFLNGGFYEFFGLDLFS